MTLKDFAIYAVMGIVLVSAFNRYLDYQKKEDATAQKQAEEYKAAKAADAKLAQQIDAVCFREAERVLSTVYNSRIIDRHGASGGLTDPIAAKTTTGWRRHFSATVSGEKKRFFGTCFVNDNFQLLDFRHTFE